jgi:asparagine synthase (glutamine-hydrolysing)
MCGLSGKLWLDPARPADQDAVRALTAALAHRGPDGEGFAAEGPCALGHRRLAIIDLSPGGAQPFRGAGGELLVANGEVYDHRALRAELESLGQRFTGDSDNEIILAAYRQWWGAEGPRFLDRLPGMFAFALWDPGARRLVLGRDRVGKKPLHYALTGEGLVFASELHALVRDPLVDRRPDWQALSDYLAFKVVGHPRTAYLGARKLPPASVLVVEPGPDGRLAAAPPQRWWRLSPGNEEGAAPTLDEAADEVLARLRTAVRRRLVADVPLGALLSGGLDSAAIVALMAQEGGTVRTFTIAFGEAEHDESAAARRLARLFGTEHHELVVAPDAVALLDAALLHHGEPFADGSALPTYVVAQLARRHVTVALGGDGGDEAFAGYDRHRALLLSARLDRPLAAPLRLGLRAAAALAVATGAAPDGAGAASGARGRGARLVRFADALDRTPRQRNHDWRLSLAPGQRAALLTPEGAALLPPPAFCGADVPLPFPLNEALVLDVERYLPDDILPKLDVASMAHALEARSPFLDHQLLEYAAALPARFKLGPAPGGGLRSKLVLRHALRRLLPADVLHGRKRGFGLPLESWFRGPLLEHAREVLLSRAARQRGLFEPLAVEALLAAHAARRVAAHEAILTLLVLERWFQREESR